MKKKRRERGAFTNSRSWLAWEKGTIYFHNSISQEGDKLVVAGREQATDPQPKGEKRGHAQQWLGRKKRRRCLPGKEKGKKAEILKTLLTRKVLKGEKRLSLCPSCGEHCRLPSSSVEKGERAEDKGTLRSSPSGVQRGRFIQKVPQNGERGRNFCRATTGGFQEKRAEIKDGIERSRGVTFLYSQQGRNEGRVWTRRVQAP